MAGLWRLLVNYQAPLPIFLAQPGSPGWTRTSSIMKRLYVLFHGLAQEGHIGHRQILESPGQGRFHEVVKNFLVKNPQH